MKRTMGFTLIIGMPFASAVLALLVIFILITSESASAQVQEAWVARYNGPANGSGGAYALAVDAAGNVYVTGYSHGSYTDSDYATIKYDANGNELWVARYDASNDSDVAIALAVDAAGNVYVTGYISGSGVSYADYATIKYDANGNELWVARYNSPDYDNGSGGAYALAVDAASNVYVTGASNGSGTNFDYATIQYDANGNEVWVARYNGPGNGNDNTKALAVDAAGNVYVTGMSDDNYVTIKLVPIGSNSGGGSVGNNGGGCFITTIGN